MVQSWLCLYLKHNWFNYVANGHEWLCDVFERYLEVPIAFVFAIIIRSIFEHHFEFLSTQNSFLWCQISEHWHFSFSLSPCRFTFDFLTLKVLAVASLVYNHKFVYIFDFHSKRLKFNYSVLWVDWSQIFLLFIPVYNGWSSKWQTDLSAKSSSIIERGPRFGDKFWIFHLSNREKSLLISSDENVTIRISSVPSGIKLLLGVIKNDLESEMPVFGLIILKL